MTARTDHRPHRLREVAATRRGYVLAWWGFTATFALLRDPFGWVSVGLALLLIGVAGSVLAITRAPREPGR